MAYRLGLGEGPLRLGIHRPMGMGTIVVQGLRRGRAQRGLGSWRTRRQQGRLRLLFEEAEEVHILFRPLVP